MTKKFSVFVTNYPAVSLFLLSFALGVLPLTMVVAGLLPTEFSQLGALSASIAGLVLSGVESGRRGVVELLRRGLIWRVPVSWWTTAVLYLAPLAAISLYVSALLGDTRFDLGGLPPLYQILPTMLVLVVLAGFGEEFGWRGFLLPRLQRHHTALYASLIVGILHSLWHLPLFLVDGTAQNIWSQQVGLMPALLGYSAFVVAWSVQLTWFFNNTGGSVLIAAVVHGAGNTWIGGYFNVSGNAGMTGNNILTALMVLLSFAIVTVAGRAHFSRVTKRNTLASDGGQVQHS